MTWVDRWRLKTHTFYLLCGDMAPTLEDVVYLLAYHCGVRPSVHESFHRTGSRICRTLSSWFRGFPERGRFKSTPGVGRPATQDLAAAVSSTKSLLIQTCNNI
jgi:hypothetical protein